MRHSCCLDSNSLALMCGWLTLLAACIACCPAVCAAGYGAATLGATTCTRCPVNTFSSGGLAVGMECTSCAAGTVSSKEATESSQCYPEFVDPTRDYFTSTDANAWTDVPSPADQAACEAACGADCLQLRISTATPLACQVMNAVAGKDVSFKVRGGVDYVRYTIGATTLIGKSISNDPAVASLAACEALCVIPAKAVIQLCACIGAQFGGGTGFPPSREWRVQAADYLIFTIRS